MKQQLLPEERSGVQIANLLSALDGSITRACIDCGEIYKVTRPDSRIYRCNPCQGKAEDAACCDSPNYRTIGCRSHPDGTTFSKRYCRNCGRTVEVES